MGGSLGCRDARRRGGRERAADAATGVVLVVLLAAPGVTILSIGSLIWWHVLLGMLLIPPVLLKLGSTGWRFARYYAGSPQYVRRGPPLLPLRLMAPLVVAAASARRDGRRRNGARDRNRSLCAALGALVRPQPRRRLARAEAQARTLSSWSYAGRRSRSPPSARSPGRSGTTTRIAPPRTKPTRSGPRSSGSYSPANASGRSARRASARRIRCAFSVRREGAASRSAETCARQSTGRRLSGSTRLSDQSASPWYRSGRPGLVRRRRSAPSEACSPARATRTANGSKSARNSWFE